jgi:hypothetical protein
MPFAGAFASAFFRGHSRGAKLDSTQDVVAIPFTMDVETSR